MSLGSLLALVALLLEVVAFAVTHDTSLTFFALVALTLAVLLSGVALPLRRLP